MEQCQACITFYNMIVNMIWRGELDKDIDEQGERINVIEEPLLLGDILGSEGDGEKERDKAMACTE